MGGEKIRHPQTGSHAQGSPPHGRGKGSKAASGVGTWRITPAWAGKSCLCWCAGGHCTDHPRMGGEKTCAINSNIDAKGSPPHGRGKAFANCRKKEHTGITPAWAGKRGVKKPLVCGIRITPARAGKSPRRSRRAAPARDHPRVGGEKAENLLPEICLPGSPPRGRGKEAHHFAHHGGKGITPA